MLSYKESVKALTSATKDSAWEEVINFKGTPDKKMILAYANIPSSQKRSLLIENLIKTHFSLTGQSRAPFYLSPKGKKIEIRSGIFTHEKTNLNQIRPFNNVDYFIISKFSPEKKFHYIFYVPAKVIYSMAGDAKKAHAMGREKNITLSTSPVDDGAYRRFCKLLPYAVKNLDEIFNKR